MRLSMCLATILMYCAVSVMTGCATGPQQSALRTIAVHGRGVIHVEPDRFMLRASVMHRDKDLERARAHVSEVTARIIDVVKSYPIDVNRTHTTRFDVEPRYHRDTYEFVTYEVDQSINICLVDLSKTEQLTMDVLQAGATSISIDFLAEQDKETLMDFAKRAAVEDARQKAELMASALGNHVGQPLEIGRPDEDWDSGGSQLFQTGNSDSGDTQSVTWVAPTQVKFEATVYVRFALSDAAED